MTETYIKCAGCGEYIVIPPELVGDWEGGDLTNSEPYFCDACEWQAETAADVDTTERCPYCGKDFEDFSDLGCAYCDTRHPAHGVLP